MKFGEAWGYGVMDIALKLKVDLMVENFEELKKDFKWDADLLKHFCAMMYATRGKKIDVDKIKKIREYIKQETGWTSEYRGTNQLIMASIISFEEDYESIFQNMLEIYKKMREEGFKHSVYLPLTTHTIAKNSSIEQWNHKIQRVNEFYKKMKENHFWLTSDDDYVFAAVLAVTDLEVEPTMKKVEICYNTLNKEGFWKGNDLQTLSHIMAIGEDDIEEKCKKVGRIYNKLKAKKCRLEYKGLATLGILALITADEDKVVEDIKEVNDFIYGKSGYGIWSLDQSTRTILSANLVSDYYIDEMKKGVMDVTLANSINAIIIAQEQAAVAAACTACAVAASASSSS